MSIWLPSFKYLFDIERIESLLQNRLGPEPPALQIKTYSFSTPSKIYQIVTKIVSKRTTCLPPVLHAPLRDTRRHTETQGSQLHNTHIHTNVLTWRCPDAIYVKLQTVSTHTSCVGQAILDIIIVYLVLQWPFNYQVSKIYLTLSESKAYCTTAWDQSPRLTKSKNKVFAHPQK